MNILNEIEFSTDKNGSVESVIIFFWFTDKKSGEIKDSRLIEKKDLSKKVEIFKPENVKGFSLFKRGVTIRTDILKFNPLKLHIPENEQVKKPLVKKISHLAELAGLSGLHVINHFDKLEAFKQTKENAN